jgi:hypothetical protein
VFGAELFDAAAAAGALPLGAVSLAPFSPIKTTVMIAIATTAKSVKPSGPIRVKLKDGSGCWLVSCGGNVARNLPSGSSAGIVGVFSSAITCVRFVSSFYRFNQGSKAEVPRGVWCKFRVKFCAKLCAGFDPSSVVTAMRT